MNENVSVEVIYNGKSSPRANYTVKYYVEKVLANANEADATKNAARALLNYGAYSQVYFGNNTESVSSVVGSSNEVEVSRLALTDYNVIAPEFVFPEDNKNESLDYFGTSLLLKTRVTLRHYFKRNGMSLEEIKQNYTFKINGKIYEPVLKNDYVYIQVEDIPAHELGEQYAVTVLKGSESIISFSFSPLNYSRFILEDNTGRYRNELKNLSMALYLYHTYSVAYRNSGANSRIYGH